MREVFIEKGDSLLRVAIKEKGELVECFIDEYSKGPQIGEIYIGRVKNIIGSTNAAFIDIGLDKEAYMYYNQAKTKKPIKKGDEVLVEVLKDPIGDKGAKVTDIPSIVGKSVVITYGLEGLEFSKKIVDLEKIEEINNNLKAIKNFKITVRTNATEYEISDIQKEIDTIVNKFQDINNKLLYGMKLGKVYGDELILRKVLMDKINTETKVITDSEEVYKSLKGDIQHVEFFDSTRNLFSYYDIEKEIIKLRHNKVVLKCGGNIIIEKTEAMYVIDVNSAQNTKGRDFNKNILETNIEAAKEIGKQIKLRNLSGIIVIDFIDFRDKNQRSKVLTELKESLRIDKGNVKIFPFTELDLVQITRKRLGKSIYEYLDEPCNKCLGKGMRLRLSYIKNLLKNEIYRCKNENSIESFYIELDETYKENIMEDKYIFLKDIDGLGEEIYINFVDRLDGYKIEPIIFQKQKENIKHMLMKPYEKY